MITDLAKNNIANCYNDEVKKVRVNGNIVIDAFVIKAVDNDTLTIEFDVPNTVISITKLETLDADNNILGTSNLYVTISNDTRFKYQLKVGN
ncbi:hypothetical protein [Bavariicoccus seileri]|uniref:hypothetical protein n=1 Tax=Bavariicoccus seileri TaxID=549685 RepID=UPI0003B63B98|nr:hypothetical protein [Bavariicoccus seileri]